MSDINYIICSCQNCSGHIKFDSKQLNPGETRKVLCPHCGLETLVFNKRNQTPNSSEQGAKNNDSIKASKSSKLELFLFELTRFPIAAGAVLIMVAIIVFAAVAIVNLLPEKTAKYPQISYQMVVYTSPTEQQSKDDQIPTQVNAHQEGGLAKTKFPQPVIDYLMAHQGFSLKEWLTQLSSDQKKAYLDNLAQFISTANSKQVDKNQLESQVKDFSDYWLESLKQQIKDQEKKIEEKHNRVNFMITVVTWLFMTLMTMSLILVLLAIERNTRIREAK
jgi:hypothetical protein